MTLARLILLLRLRIKPDALLPFVGIHSKTMALVWPYSGARFCWWNQQDEGRDLTGTAVEGRMLRRVSTITSNSIAGRDFLVDTYGLDPRSILVYNNGTPVAEENVDPREFRARLGLGDRRVVTMLANITPFKDHGTLLEAWTIVRRHSAGGEVPVLLLAGHLRDEGAVTALKVRAFELGLSADDVRFLGPVENVGELMANSDLVVHSSLTEGCPNAVCEAMAFARAVVATDIPGCRQALGEGGAQWLAAPGNAGALAERMIRLLEDPGLRAETGETNRRRIASDFTIEGMNRFFQTQIEAGLRCSLS